MRIVPPVTNRVTSIDPAAAGCPGILKGQDKIKLHVYLAKNTTAFHNMSDDIQSDSILSNMNIFLISPEIERFVTGEGPRLNSF